MSDSEGGGVRRDLVVLGAGLAARSAALEAASCGLQVLLLTCADEQVRRAEAAAVSAKVRSLVEDMTFPSGWSGEDGAASRSPTPELRAQIESLVRMATTNASPLEGCAAHPSIEVCHAAVEFDCANKIRTDAGLCWEFPLAVIATDGPPRQSTRFQFDGHSVCDADSIWLRGTLPRSAVIVGADAEGCALGSILAGAGVPVTIVDRRSRCLRYLDPDLLEFFHERLHQIGVEVVLSEDLNDVRVDVRGSEPYVLVELASGRHEPCDVLVVVAGRESGTDRLRLDRAGVETDERGFILTSERGETSRGGIFATGRVVSDLGFSADEYSGRTVVRAALGLGDEGILAMPLVIGAVPEIAMAGLTAEMCCRLGVPHVASRAEFQAGRTGQHRASRPPGVLKLVVQKDTRVLLGVQAIGVGSSELVQLGRLLIAGERSIGELLGIAAPFGSPWASYPTAARDALRLARD